MGVSTDGQLCFGLVFEEGFEFPWDSEEYEGDVDLWWLDGINKFKHSFDIYDAKGEYLNGIEPSKELISRYFAEEREFFEAHPCPVTTWNYCSGGSPMYILSPADSGYRSSRGYPKEVDPDVLMRSGETQLLIDFCNTYNIEIGAQQPKWWLSSYWG